MRKKPVTIILSLLATLTLLFGGWFFYQKMEVEGPVRAQFEQMKSAELADLRVEPEQIVVKLKVNDPGAFPEEYKATLEQIEQRVQEKELNVTILNDNKDLKAVWDSGIFAFTEAVELHQYSKIPVLLESWKEQFGLTAVTSQMDETHIYVNLQRGDQHFYVMVPRVLGQEEVTSNG